MLVSCRPTSMRLFLSTPSARRATVLVGVCVNRCKISIHALREEGDRHHLAGLTAHFQHFYPRPPRGGRRVA